MNVRNYTAMISITLVSEDGKILGTKTEEAPMILPMEEFPNGANEADAYMLENLHHMAALATNIVSDCATNC